MCHLRPVSQGRVKNIAMPGKNIFFTVSATDQTEGKKKKLFMQYCKFCLVTSTASAMCCTQCGECCNVQSLLINQLGLLGRIENAAGLPDVGESLQTMSAEGTCTKNNQNGMELLVQDAEIPKPQKLTKHLPLIHYDWKRPWSSFTTPLHFFPLLPALSITLQWLIYTRKRLTQAAKQTWTPAPSAGQTAKCSMQLSLYSYNVSFSFFFYSCKGFAAWLTRSWCWILYCICIHL